MPVPDIIIDTIRRQGPLSFVHFMEMALYYPEQGYYASTSPGNWKRCGFIWIDNLCASSNVGPGRGFFAAIFSLSSGKTKCYFAICNMSSSKKANPCANANGSC